MPSLVVCEEPIVSQSPCKSEVSNKCESERSEERSDEETYHEPQSR